MDQLTKHDVEQKIKKILALYLEKETDEITIEQRLSEDLGIPVQGNNQFDVTDLFIAIEQELKSSDGHELEFSSQDLEEIKTVLDIVNCVIKKIKAPTLTAETKIVQIISEKSSISTDQIAIDSNLITDLAIEPIDLAGILEEVERVFDIKLPKIKDAELTVDKLIKEVVNQLI
jgi:acyl carrier protein